MVKWAYLSNIFFEFVLRRHQTLNVLVDIEPDNKKLSQARPDAKQNMEKEKEVNDFYIQNT